ncbi:hypothetical protein AMATHDRAFT_49464 [Amanita thiersii Skay4041]|uniref:Major facilitator superfamily (MFS) profile domain-containing protein n=1 Tax=Amanita thiersii Skay4041 TaxID=703135 RepID=A0A2A9NJS1_9AGAR|nr:hypothetical protein AMATHDRAFT_49464 [Amanita thiersii Skay4041]
MSNIEDSRLDEETPLLPEVSNKKKPTPLPKLQIGILLLLQLCEPIASTSIYPYINKLVSELGITGGDERKVGYYAGLLESLYFATEAVTVLQWSRASDHIGRKPILLFGLVGMTLSMLSFGLSRTYGGLMISRCLCGLLNGNIGVMKSVMGELTDPSNRAEAFALIPVVWATGATLGPMMGGALARPHERFPSYFSSQFWKNYPYFLPCAVGAASIAVAFVIALLLFKETLPKNSQRRNSRNVTHEESKPVALRQLLVYPVLISVSNYVIISFLDIAVLSLIPLFMAMPREIGGLGSTPAVIGSVLGSYGFLLGLYQTVFFAKIVRRFGERRVFITSMSTFPIIFTLFPIMSMISKNYGTTWVVWALLYSVLVLMAIMCMGFGCIFIYITASSPNKRSLGATNGLSQTSVSIARAVGPALATSMFSFSVEKNLLGGYAVYFVLFTCACLAIPLALGLPQKVWEEKD